MKVVKKKSIGKQTVYDIGVRSDDHNFITEHGLVASNCFNAAHSYAYSLLGYWECWLKTYYPLEFMTALMTHEDDLDKLSSYISESRSMGLDVRGPDINKSGRGFTIHNDVLHFGFESIKGLGKTAAYYIVKARHKVPYKNFMDFMARVNRRKVTSIKVEQLALAGAFDNMGYDRGELLRTVKDVVKYYKDIDDYHEKLKRYNEREALRTKIIAEGGSLAKARALKEPVLPVRPEIQATDNVMINLKTLEGEKSVLGCYMTLHPTDFVQQTNDTDRIVDICMPKQTGKLNGVVCRIKEIETKKARRRMAFLEIEDQTGRADVVVFPNTWAKLKTKPVLHDFVRVMYEAEDPGSTPKKLIAKKLRMIQVM